MRERGSMCQRVDTNEQEIQSKWVSLLTNNGDEGKRAYERLKAVGFHVNAIGDSSCTIPVARINGDVYRGLSEIEELAESREIKSRNRSAPPTS